MPKDESPPRTSLPQRLRRRWKWGVAALAALALYTLFGFFIVPRIIRNQIGTRATLLLQRSATVDDVSFNPFTLTASMKGFRLADRDGADLITIGSMRANLQVSGILRLALRFREIVVEQPVVAIRVLADGKPSLSDLIEPETPADPNAGTRLRRFIIDRLAVSGGVVRFSDASHQPAYETSFEPLNLEIKDLISIPEEGGEHSITIGVGEGAELRWTGRQTVEPLSFTGRLDITGLSLKRLWDYFGQRQALDITDGHADLALPYEIKQGADLRFQLLLDGVSMAVRSIAAGPRGQGETWLSVPEVRVLNVKAAWPSMKVEVGAVKIVKPHALARIEADGALNWLKMIPPAAGQPAAASAAPPLDVKVASVELEGGSARFEDLSVSPSAAIDISDLAVSAQSISSNLAAPVPFEVRGRYQEKGLMEVRGSVTPSPLAAEISFDMKGLDLVPLRPYVTVVPGAVLSSGSVSVHGKVVAAGAAPSINLTTEGALDGLEIEDSHGERLIACGQIGISGARLEHPPLRLRVSKVTLDRAFAKILIDKEGNLNLANLAPPGQAASAAPAAAAPAVLPAVEVGRVEIRGASGEYADQSLLLPFKAVISAADGAVRDLSTTASAPASIALEGRVNETGHIKVGGELRLADPFAASEIRAQFRSVEMPQLTPYVAEFAGYAVRRGNLDLDLRYQVKDRRLVGDHKLVVRDLELGDKVEGSPSSGLPVHLAIALLKDKDGKIDIDVPIEGSIDAPQFAYRTVFWSAVKSIMGNLCKAPFRAIGRLFGKDEPDLELVEFDVGRTDLLPAEQDKLSKLAAEIGPRSGLTLSVEGRFDPAADPAAMKLMKLEALIESRRPAAEAAAAASGRSTLETILESLFLEQFSAEALQAERLRFTAPPAEPPAPAQQEPQKKKGGQPAPPPPAAPAFDATGFYDALRGRLLEAQVISQADLNALASARAAAIIGALTGAGAVEPVRVTASDPAPAKRKKDGSARVASEMTMSAETADGKEKAAN